MSKLRTCDYCDIDYAGAGAKLRTEDGGTARYCSDACLLHGMIDYYEVSALREVLDLFTEPLPHGSANQPDMPASDGHHYTNVEFQRTANWWYEQTEYIPTTEWETETNVNPLNDILSLKEYWRRKYGQYNSGTEAMIPDDEMIEHVTDETVTTNTDAGKVDDAPVAGDGLGQVATTDDSAGTSAPDHVEPQQGVGSSRTWTWLARPPSVAYPGYSRFDRIGTPDVEPTTEVTLTGVVNKVAWDMVMDDAGGSKMVYTATFTPSSSPDALTVTHVPTREPTDHEIDEYIAEHLFGWGYRLGTCPNYTTDLAADYAVLQAVRAIREHGMDLFERFDEALYDLHAARREDVIESFTDVHYQIGDYARSYYTAHKALNGD